MGRRFRLVDVFGSGSLSGNPLAVVIDSDGLNDTEMLQITRWLNLSETTFLLPPEDEGAHYRVRIFSLFGELPFAGHPTLGTCHVWADVNDDHSDEIVQECGAGLVRLRSSDGGLAFEAPPLIRGGPVDPVELAGFAEVLGVNAADILDASWVDNGPGWVGLLLKDAGLVLDLEPDFSCHPTEEMLTIGAVGFHAPGSECLYEVRAFFSDLNGRMVEDPVTGSLNASVAEWLMADGRAEAPYVAGQGSRLNRTGRVYISQDAEGTVWIGGNTASIVAGVLDI